MTSLSLHLGRTIVEEDPRTSAPPSPTLSPATPTDVVDGYQVPVDPMDQLQCDGCQ